MSKKTKKQTPQPEELRLDFGAGRNPIPNFKSVDLYAPEADFKVDLFKFPLPWKDESVTEIHASHFVEHIPGKIRWPFFEECWRILKPGGTMRISCPNWKSERSYGDMTHEWPPVTAMFFFYLHKGWRDANKLTYGVYDIRANFDHQMGPSGINAPWYQKSQDAQQFACSHYVESFQDIWIILTKRPLDYVLAPPS